MKKLPAKSKSLLVDLDDTLGKPIRIACKGAALIDIETLTNFQGNLKVLPEDAYQKLRSSIIELGFSFPIHAWKHRNKTFILDAHQRVLALKRMRDEEGFTIPKLPVVWVEASNTKEAAKKLLAATSNYGQMTADGLFSFVNEFKIDIDSMALQFSFPEIDLGHFQEAFNPSTKEVTFQAKDGAKEYEASSFDGFDHKCPKCSFTWSDKKPK